MASSLMQIRRGKLPGSVRDFVHVEAHSPTYPLSSSTQRATSRVTSRVLSSNRQHVRCKSEEDTKDEKQHPLVPHVRTVPHPRSLLSN